jgi:hypothetical protein
MDPPEEVVTTLQIRRLPERGHAGGLGAEPGEDVLDRAVLPSGIHGLEHHEQGPAPLGLGPAAVGRAARRHVQMMSHLGTPRQRSRFRPGRL